MANEKTVNVLDYMSVSNGAVHNIGAGGVNGAGIIDAGNINDERFDQYCRRTDRACGHRGLNHGYQS